jgi:sugar transferase (PEP-CTERM system associated)
MFRIGGQKVPTRTILLIGSDAFFIVLGLLFVTAVRFHARSTIRNYLQGHLTVWRFALVVLVCIFALYYNDLYNERVLSHRQEALVRLVQALGITFLALAIIYYLDPDLSLGRGIAVLAAPTILALALAWRWILESSGVFGTGAERLLMLGTGKTGVTVVREILARPEMNYKVIGFLDEEGQNIGKSLVNPGIIGSATEVEAIALREKADRVILSLAERRGRTPIRQLLQLKFEGIIVEDAETLYESICGRIMLENLSPSWLILSDGFRKHGWVLFCKRLTDILVSLAALLILWPVFLATALAILLETGRPILFRQERTGMKGRSFEILKFRSMRQDAEANGPVWAATADNRITKVGRFLRKYRLDEFPQLLNVLRGEMSLVGPRPERPVFCQMLADQIPFYNLRHSVRPGVTGWAQIKYQYSASVEETKSKLEYDIFYVKHLSLVLDLAIIFETAKVMIHGHGAK